MGAWPQNRLMTSNQADEINLLRSTAHRIYRTTFRERTTYSRQSTAKWGVETNLNMLPAQLARDFNLYLARRCHPGSAQQCGAGIDRRLIFSRLNSTRSCSHSRS